MIIDDSCSQKFNLEWLKENLLMILKLLEGILDLMIWKSLFTPNEPVKMFLNWFENRFLNEIISISKSNQVVMDLKMT